MNDYIGWFGKFIRCISYTNRGAKDVGWNSVKKWEGIVENRTTRYLCYEWNSVILLLYVILYVWKNNNNKDSQIKKTKKRDIKGKCF